MTSVTTSDDENVFFGFSFDETDVCILTQDDYVTAFNKATKLSLLTSFTLNKQVED